MPVTPVGAPANNLTRVVDRSGKGIRNNILQENLGYLADQTAGWPTITATT